MYFVRKIGVFLLTLFAIITLNFIIPRLMPGDPAELMVQNLGGVGQNDSTGSRENELNLAQVQAYRALLGDTSEPIHVQYIDYWKHIIVGDFGTSYSYFPFPVTEVIGHAFWWSFGLLTVVNVLSFIIGMLLGSFAAWRRNSRFDTIVTSTSTFFGSLNHLWIALLFIFALGYGLGWFPTAGGWSTSTIGWNWEFVYDAISHAFLPALTLMVITPVAWVMGMRNTMIINLREDYIRLARAKGLPDKDVALKYAARNALLPSITGFALTMSSVLGGSMLVESAFDYPGLGRLMVEATEIKDYPLMQALMMLGATATLVANLVADILYGVLDPRARKASA